MLTINGRRPAPIANSAACRLPDWNSHSTRACNECTLLLQLHTAARTLYTAGCTHGGQSLLLLATAIAATAATAAGCSYRCASLFLRCNHLNSVSARFLPAVIYTLLCAYRLA